MITTKEIELTVIKMLEERGKLSAPLELDFPGHCCISVNEEVCHGIPSRRPLEDGDIVKIDISFKDKVTGVYDDFCDTYFYGNPRPEDIRLVNATHKCFLNALEYVRSGEEVSPGAIGHIIEKTAREAGFNVVKEYGGHGIGNKLHMPPFIPNFDNGDHIPIPRGTRIAIEPILTPGDGRIVSNYDGWTIVTLDGTRAAQYERTIVV